MSLIVTIFGKDKLSKKLKAIGKIVGGLVVGFGKWDRIVRTVFIGATIKLAADLQKGLREIGTLMGGLTDNEIKNMGHELQIVAARSGEAMKSLVKARYDIVSAGFVEVSESLQLLNASANLAVGGVTNVANAADLLTTTLNAYNLTSDQAIETSDKLFTIVRLGKTTMNELGGSMGRVLAIAGQASVSLDEVGAALATLTAQGQSTEEATTAIRSAIVELLKPSEDLTGVIEELGFQSGIALIQSEGFAGAIQMIKEQADESNIPMTDLFGNIRSMQAVLPLTGTAMESFITNLEAMKNSTGATANAVEEMQKSFTVQLNILKANVSNIMTEIGNVFIEVLQPKIEEANEVLATLGEIGWDKVGAFMLDNWGEILEKMWRLAQIGGEIIGQKLWQGIKSAFTPDFLKDLFSPLPTIAERAMKISKEMGISMKEAFVIVEDSIEKVEEKAISLEGEFHSLIDFLVFGATGVGEAFTKSWSDSMLAFEDMNDLMLEDVAVMGDIFKKTGEKIEDALIPDPEKVASGLQLILDKYNITFDQLDEISSEFRQKQAEMDNLSFFEQIERINEFAEIYKAAKIEENAIDQWVASEKLKLITDYFSKASGLAQNLFQIFSNLMQADLIKLSNATAKKIKLEEKKATNEILLAGGNAEEILLIEENKEEAIANIREGAAEAEAKLKRKQKKLTRSIAIAKGASAVVQTFEAFGGWPVGVVPALIMAGLVASQVAIIDAQKFKFGGKVPEIKGFAFGGSSQDTVPSMLSPREIVSTPAASDLFGNEITRFNQLAETGFGGGGGDVFNINISALDGADVERVLKRNPDSFARGFKDLKRRNFI